MKKLHEIAHVRSGDKGNTAQISVIAYSLEDYPALERTLTTSAIRNHFETLSIGLMERYELPQLGALNFVLHDALSGGVTSSIKLDPHGKTLAAQLLDMNIASRRHEPLFAAIASQVLPQ